MAPVRTLWLDHLVDASLAGEDSARLVASAIAHTIACDHVFTADVDFSTQTFAVDDPLSPVGPLPTEVLLTPAGMHPAIASYLQDPTDRSPRRVSDVTDAKRWLGSTAYQRVFRAVGGRHQLSMVTEMYPPSIGRGWVLTRDTRDFSDRDVEKAGQLLPALAIAARLARRTAQRQVPVQIVTWRESEILLSLSLGASADEIGAELGISPRTVRKHLENIYRKLQCHDRVHALRKARDLGILAP